jgi:putative ABC transport system permease protein
MDAAGRLALKLQVTIWNICHPGVVMHALLQNLRFALRQLRKSPGFTATAILSLALGIGATTAVFSVVWAILMNPYPYANPDRMVHLRILQKDGGNNGFGMTAPQWQILRKSPVVEDAFLTDSWNLTVTGSDFPEDVNADYVSSNTFNFMGVAPSMGRQIQPSDAVDGQDPQPVVVLSYKFWQRHFNADTSMIGKTLQLVRKNYTIIGVAAPRFTWDDADVYLPKKITQDQKLGYYVGVRLKPGVTHDQADQALQPMIRQFAKDTPTHYPKGDIRFHVVGLNEDFVQRLGGTLYLLFTAVALLLLIGCGNVSILLLARGTARQHEFAIRSAVGATRRRMMMQLLTESLLLSISGAALGVALAYAALVKIVDTLPQFSFPHEASIHINLPVLIFAVAVAVLTGVLFGLWPAMEFSRPEVSQMMQAGTRKVAGSVAGRRTLGSLVGVQIALTLLMLAGAGAALEGFVKLSTVHLGYDPHNIMSVGIPVHDGSYGTWESRRAFFEALRQKIGETQGVGMAAISSNATPPSNGFNSTMQILGKPALADQNIRVNLVSEGYFPALRITLAQGRIWDEAENHNGATVAVINQTLARKYFPAGDALGHSFKIDGVVENLPYLVVAPSMKEAGANQWLRVVGIIEDKLDDGLDKPVKPEAFVPYTLAMGTYTQVLVRSDVSPLTLLHAIRKQVSTIDADQQTNGTVRDLDHWISTQPEYAQGQFISWLFGAFAVLALLLAAVGLYSVVSYSVAQRTNEFGIRMALGAPRGHVLQIVFRSMLVSVGVGIAAGLILAFALNKVLAQWAEGSSRDLGVLIGASLLLAAVAAIACAIPARRASRVDPMAALRYE